MDVPPPLYELTREACAGETRHCHDDACVRRAEKDGDVAISLYGYCR